MTQIIERSEPVFFAKRVEQTGKERELIDISEKVLSFSYEDSEKKADKLALTLDNWDLEAFDDPFWQKGALLEVSWGYPGDLAPPREVVIQSIRGFQSLQIEANSKLMLMNKLAKNEIYENITRAKVAEKIATRNGFGKNKQVIEETQESFVTVSQARLTDAQFMKRLADKEGFEFFVDFDGFHFHKKKLGQRPLKAFTWYTDPDQGDILSISITSDSFAKPGRVRVKGRDPIKKEDIDEAGSDKDTNRETISAIPENVDPDNAEAREEKINASEDIRPTPQTTTNSVKREADAKFRKTQQATHELNMVIIGDPSILAKSIIEIRNISKRLSGLWYVEEARHSIDSNGYITSIKAIRDGSSEVPGKKKGTNISSQKAKPEQKCKEIAGTINSFIDATLRATRIENRLVSSNDEVFIAFDNFANASIVAKSRISGSPTDTSYYAALKTTANTLAIEAAKVGAIKTASTAKQVVNKAKLGKTSCGSAKSGANENKSTVKDTDTNELEQTKRTDSKTGKTVVEYVDTRGRKSR